MNPTVDEIGMRVQLTVNAVNRGPSTTSGATLDIFIPTNDVENSYYLYLYDVTVTGAPATCDRSALNPEGLPLPGNRNRRLVHSKDMRRATTAEYRFPYMHAGSGHFMLWS